MLLLGLCLLLATPGRAQNRFVTHDDSNQVPQNRSKSGNVLVNDDNPANLANTAFGVVLVTPPAHGTLLSFNLDGSYTYSPTAGYVGADSFTYQICQPRSSGNCSNVSAVALNVYDPALACTQGTGPNLLQNPSFAAGNTGFLSGYTFVPTPSSTPSLYSEGTYAIGNNANAYHPDFQGTGHTADNFMIVNGAAVLQSVYSQTVTVFPNRFYTISVWAVSVYPSSPAQLGLVVDGKSTSVVTTLPAASNQYVKLEDLYFSGPGPAAGRPVTFEVRDINKALGGNDFGIDDVYFGSCSTDLLADTKTTGAVGSAAGPTAILPLSATLSVGANSGVQAAYFTVTSLPATGTLTYNGVPVVVGQQLPVSAPGSLSSGGVLAYSPGGSCAAATFTYTATDNAGNVSSNIATYTIPVTGPTVAVVHAPAGPFCAGAQVRLGAGAQPGYAYTWYRGSTIVNGAGNVLNDSVFVASTSGIYTVKVAVTGCSTTSAAFTLTILSAVAAGTIEADQTICLGTAPALLTTGQAGGGGTGTYAYQWESSADNINWAPIGGATTGTYAPGALTATTYYRRKTVSGPCDAVYSNIVTLTVQPLVAASVALAAPAAQCAGTALTFTPTVANAGPAPTYRWLVNGTAVASATGATFTSSTLASGDQVRVEVAPSAGLCSSGAATATVAVVLTSSPAPSVSMLALPAGPVCPGTALVFSVDQVANAGGASQFQWQVDGVAVAGQTASAFTSTTLRDGQLVRVVLTTTNACGQPATAISAPVRVAISPVVVVSAGPDKTIFEGDQVLLEGTANGNYPVGWSPAQSLTLGSNPLQPLAAPTTTTTYTLTAGTGGCASTSQVTVTVLSPLGIPNAFSPNGDGNDDTWEIDRIGNFSGNRVVVFNRWGNPVFQTNSYQRGNEWDGTVRGQPAPLGTYYYVITLGTGRAYSGWVTVLR
ncbi:MAG: T9SS type B sorting domain-containing protein [Hymenobacter sp.]|nr:MAG: T9SS type B sorting domain-containing protein [Hymenobacter sp.]